MKCPQCGTNWAAGETFCEICQIEMTTAKRSRKKKGRSKKKQPVADDPNSGRYLVSGIVGLVLGGLILLSALVRGLQDSDPAFFAGQICGLVFGFLLFGCGIYYVIRGLK